MAGTTHFRFYGSSNSGQKWRIDIMDTTYAGTDFADVFPDGNGVGVGWEGANEEIYIPVVKSTASIALHRDTNSRLLLDLTVEGPEARFIVILFKDVSSTYVRYWQGFLLQDSLSKPDAADNTDFIEITATDGFGLLEDLEYAGYDVNAIVRYTITEWLAKIAVKMPLDYVEVSEPLFAFASVWYEDSQQSSVIPTPQAGDPMGNTLISESAFIQVDDYGQTVAKSYGEILKAILSVTGLQLSQWNGKYLFIQPNTYAQAQTRAWYYDKQGTYIDTELIDLQAAMPARFTDGTFNYQLPAKVVTTEYEYRQGLYKNNLLPFNVDINTEYSLGLSTQNAELSVVGQIETIYNGSGGDLVNIQAVYKLLIKNGPQYLNQNASGEYVWDTNASNYVPVYSRRFRSDYAGDQTIVTLFDVLTILPEEDKDLSFEWQFYRYEIWEEGIEWYDPANTNTATHDDIEGTFIARINTGIIQEGTLLYKAHVSNSARSDIELEAVGLGDGANKYSAGALFVNDTTPEVVESNVWTIYSEIGGTAYPINSLRCREMLALMRSTIQTYDGYFHGSPNIHKGFEWLGVKWKWQSIEWNMREDRYSGTALAVILDRTGITVDTPLPKQDQNSSGSPGTGSGEPVFVPYPLVNDILEYRDGAYRPYAAKKTADPGFAYGYLGTTNPTFANRLNWDAYVYATKFSATIASNGTAVFGASSTGYGGEFQSTSGPGMYAHSDSNDGVTAQSTSGKAGNFVIIPTSTNSLAEIIKISRSSSGSAANNIGGYIGYYIKNSTGSIVEAGRHACKFTDVTNTSEKSMFEWFLKSAGTLARKMGLTDIGKLILDTYGSGTHTGIPAKALNVDASGNVIESNVAPLPLADFFSDSGNVASSDTDLYTYTLPANALTVNGQKLKIIFAGNSAVNGNSKLVYVMIDGNPVGSQSFVGSNYTWRYEITCIRSDTDKLRIIGTGSLTATTEVQFYAEITVDFTAGIDIKLVGDGTANNDVIARMGTIELIQNS